ncbi:hypothetical protein [Streptomyces sp. NPDC059863]|uniref:hypothetical protein n=1 Tax=unclassified Streptomyces TaxID=2593676 RepID=UPI0036638254
MIVDEHPLRGFAGTAHNLVLDAFLQIRVAAHRPLARAVVARAAVRRARCQAPSWEGSTM